jgi:hypothetical protein
MEGEIIGREKQGDTMQRESERVRERRDGGHVR